MRINGNVYPRPAIFDKFYNLEGGKEKEKSEKKITHHIISA